MARLSFAITLGLLAAATATLAAPPDGGIDCSKVDEMLDELGQAQAVSTLSAKYPLITSEEEWLKRCQDSTEAMKTMKRINRDCYTTLTQQVISAMLRTRSAMLDLSCKPGTSEFRDTIAIAKCIKENSFDTLKKAETETLAMTQQIAEMSYPDDKARTLRSCCTVEQARKTMTDIVKQKCGQYEAIMNEHADSFTSEAMGLICGGIDKAQCASLPAVKTEGVTLKSVSYIVPAIKAIKAIDHA